MVYHLVIAAQTGVLILYGIKTMRAAGYDLFDLVSIQHLYIGNSLHLEQKLVARPFSRVAGAAFFSSQHSIIDTHVLQYFADIARYLLRPLVKAACTSHPKQYLRLFALRGHFGHGWNG
jgi:hypothetical protein